MIKLRCPFCKLEATIKTLPKHPGNVEISTQYRTALGVDYRTYQTKLPAFCCICDTILKVVRECFRCEGTGNKDCWHGPGPYGPKCSDCKGAGEILEEQP